MNTRPAPTSASGQRRPGPGGHPVRPQPAARTDARCSVERAARPATSRASGTSRPRPSHRQLHLVLPTGTRSAAPAGWPAPVRRPGPRSPAGPARSSRPGRTTGAARPGRLTAARDQRRHGLGRPPAQRRQRGSAPAPRSGPDRRAAAAELPPGPQPVGPSGCQARQQFGERHHRPRVVHDQVGRFQCVTTARRPTPAPSPARPPRRPAGPAAAAARPTGGYTTPRPARSGPPAPDPAGARPPRSATGGPGLRPAALLVADSSPMLQLGHPTRTCPTVADSSPSRLPTEGSPITPSPPTRTWPTTAGPQPAPGPT